MRIKLTTMLLTALLALAGTPQAAAQDEYVFGYCIALHYDISRGRGIIGPIFTMPRGDWLQLDHQPFAVDALERAFGMDANRINKIKDRSTKEDSMLAHIYVIYEILSNRGFTGDVTYELDCKVIVGSPSFSFSLHSSQMEQERNDYISQEVISIVEVDWLLPSGSELADTEEPDTEGSSTFCNRTPAVRDEIMRELMDLGILTSFECELVIPEVPPSDIVSRERVVTAEELASMTSLDITTSQLATGDLDGLTGLRELSVNRFTTANLLTALPAGVFNGLTNLGTLDLSGNQLTALPAGVFNGLTNLGTLDLSGNQLTALPAGVFNGLTNLRTLDLSNNQLTNGGLPDGVFNGLTNLWDLDVRDNLFCHWEDFGTLPLFDSEGLRFLFRSQKREADCPTATLIVPFSERTPQLQVVIRIVLGKAENDEVTADDLANVRSLDLSNANLPELSAGDLDGMVNLSDLDLSGNELTTLPPNLFDDLGNLETLDLSGNELTTLPPNLFDDLGNLETLDLSGNHLVGLSTNDPVFAALPSGVDLGLGGQTEAPATQMPTAVPTFVSSSDTTRQGFVRIINESSVDGTVRVTAVDDGGTEADPVEIPIGANQALHFNSEDLESGNAAKGIANGIGRPRQGNWKLDMETALDISVLSYIRTNDGFLTAMHDVLQRDAQGRMMVPTFNPASNTSRVSNLRLVNTGANAEGVSIEGVDDQGASAGPVRLTLAAGEARTLSAQDLESGAQGLTGSLGDGAGKWRLFISAGQAVVGVSLLDSISGHLANLSTWNAFAGVPLFLSTSDATRQGFVRIINESNEAGKVRITAVDDGGTEADPVEIPIGANQALHFNSEDLESGNAAKGIANGIGRPRQGNWRLAMGTDLPLAFALSYIRTNDGFLTAMHDVLQRDAQGRMMVPTFNPASNTSRVSNLRLVNTGANAERVSIAGVDDQGESAEQVSLTLAAGEARTLTAQQLENGASGLTGRLGDGAGKWRLFISAGQAVVGMSLLDSASGHLSDLSAMGEVDRKALPVVNLSPPNPPTNPPPPPPSRQYYGAFALSSPDAPGAWKYGLTYNFDSSAKADSEALRLCRSVIARGDSCSIQARFGTGQCFVVYSGNNGHFVSYGYAPRASLALLKQQRLAGCRENANNCRLEDEVCNAGTFTGIAPHAASANATARRKATIMPPESH